MEASDRSDDVPRFTHDESKHLRFLTSEDNDDACNLTADKEDELCESCREIDFEKLIKDTMPRLREITSRKGLLGKRLISTKHTFSPRCSLCRMLDIAEDSRLALEESYCLFALPLPLSIFAHHDEDTRVLSPPNSIWLFPDWEVPYGDPSRLEKQARWAAEGQEAWTACFLTNQTPSLFRPQPISRRFDSATISKRLTACKNFHGLLCNHSVQVQGLWLIDCEELALIQASESLPYFALSYVWAKRQSNNVDGSTASNPKGPHFLPPYDRLPQVVKDSMVVVKQLGFRYLWVDKYCIDQIDPVIQNEQLGNMGMIYRGAELTIIAAAGLDERQGLPGVTVDRSPHILEIGKCTITTVPTQNCNRSVWAERAWTFQEELFSRRRLYFMDEQAVFYCSEMTGNEASGGAEYIQDATSMKEYSKALSRIIPEQNRTVLWLQLPGISKEADQSELTHNVSLGFKSKMDMLMNWLEIYSTRKLTYESDALRAFAGVFQAFEVGEYPIFNLQGLPVLCTPDRQISCSAMNLIAALCWRQPDEALRRTEFPSWTWAGWIGSLYFHDALMDPPLFEVGMIDSGPIIVHYEDGHKMALEELAKSFLEERDKKSFNHARHDSGPAQHNKSSIRELSNAKAIEMFAPVFRIEDFSGMDQSTWIECRIAGMRLVNIGERYPLAIMPFRPVYLLNGLKTGTMECVLIRIDRYPEYKSFAVQGSHCVHILVLQRSGFYEAQRIGKFTAIAEENTDLVRLVHRMKWKNIKLV